MQAAHLMAGMEDRAMDTSDEYDPRSSDIFEHRPESQDLVEHYDKQLESRLQYCREMVNRHRGAADFWEKEAAIIQQFRSGDWNRPKAMPEPGGRMDHPAF